MSAQLLLKDLIRYKASAGEELLDVLNAPGLDASSPDFQSALRVLHHAHVVDRIFAAHLRRVGHPYRASWSRETPDLAELSAAIRETDRWYVDYVSDVGEKEIEEMIDFTFTDGASGRMSRAEMLAHVVTHAGYHRGEVGRLLPQIEATAMRDVFAGYLHRADPQRRL